MYFVYELVDPRTDIAGYVGITSNPNRRYYEHLEEIEGEGKKHDWIQSLQKQQAQPKMKILEIVDNLKQAQKQERYWIQHYISKGIELKNTILYSKKEKAVSIKVATGDYYTRKQAMRMLNINILTFNVFLQKGLITNAFPDRQDQVDCYLKSGIDELATKLEMSRKRYGPEKFKSFGTSRKRE